MPSPRPQHGYLPIPAKPPSHTRILTLLPGGASSPLEVTLTVENVQVCNPYDALSYVWGKEKSTNFLIRDGQPVQIQANLDAALRSLRLPNRPLRLWVDAICIDQENLSERSSQVQIMKLIYKHAKTVIIWLGPETEGVSGAIRLALQLNEIRKRLKYIPNITLQRSPAMGYGLDPNSVKEYIDPNSDEWRHLEALFMRDWWERVWCVQELVVSSNCIGRCGDNQIDMESLLSASVYLLNKRGEFFQSKALIFWNDVYLRKFRTSLGEIGYWSASGTTNLMGLLESVKSLEATDPRDRVFAVVGMSIEGINQSRSLSTVLRQGTGPSRSTIFKFFTDPKVPSKDIDRIMRGALIPSYTTPYLNIYRDITRFLILHDHILHILSQVQHPQDIIVSNTDHDLTWVPRWDERPYGTPMGNHSWFFAGLVDEYKLYLSRKHHDRLYARTKNPNVLSLDGFQYDRVAKVSEIIKEEMNGNLSIKVIWHQLFDTEFPPTDASGTHILEDLGMALMGGQYSQRPYGTEGYKATAGRVRLPPGTYFLRGAAITFAYCTKHYNFNKSHVHPSVLQKTLPDDDNDTKFQDLVRLVTHNRRAYVTNEGRLGLGPIAMKPGDRICVFIGGRIPFAVRPVQKGWILVGEAYLHDVRLMTGKVAIDVLSMKHAAQLETFDLY